VIRVNLLPHKRDGKKASAPLQAQQGWVVVLLVCVLVEAGGLYLFHQSELGDLAMQTRKNQSLARQISEIHTVVAGHEQVKQQLLVLRQREDAIAKLQVARTGPTGMLLELSRVMTPSRGPSVDAEKLAQLRRENPLAVPNLAWDAHRLWLTSFKEAAGTVTMEGLARDGDDVSELARRLGLSASFGDVRLLPASKMTDPDSKVEVLKFQLQAKAHY